MTFVRVTYIGAGMLAMEAVRRSGFRLPDVHAQWIPITNQALIYLAIAVALWLTGELYVTIRTHQGGRH